MGLMFPAICLQGFSSFSECSSVFFFLLQDKTLETRAGDPSEYLAVYYNT